MATLEQAVAAKEKFKAEYWSKNQDKYNAITIGVDIGYDETAITEDEFDAGLFETNICITQEYCVKAFLFDIENAFELPILIDGVEIRYFDVMEK
jgi:hypothetical protein